MEYRKFLNNEQYKETWSRAGTNKYSRLFQRVRKNDDGRQCITGTDTYHWMPQSKVPKGKKITFARIVVEKCPEKDDPNRVRITTGGVQLDYYGETSAETCFH